MHARTAERIAEAAEITSSDTVLEIGPGTGMLTRALLARAKCVVAVEADVELIPRLEETFQEDLEKGKLRLVSADIRSYDPSELGAYKLVANIPYYITGEIIRTFLSGKSKPGSMTLLVQKEVAERIVRSKKESLLSLSVKVYGTPHYRFTVPRGAFVPAPNVDSAVLSVTGIHDSFASSTEEGAFFKLLHAGFAHKRKLLVRNLEDVAPRDAILTAFHEASLPEKVRAEDVSLASWKLLTSLLLTHIS